MNALPEPALARWQPLRAGLIDIFYYDVEEFWFHDGRLLLRGNNGTGKSKVLALMLPFLLDGDLAPHRVEPDADPKKRMEWNLLLGGEHPHPERLGYTWLEFGRRTEDGTSEFRTIGCGLKAVSGRGIARHWFFVTDQRVGAQLRLVDATRTALTRERLTEALTGHGQVYDRRQDYRRAVDETLFGLGEQRYGALVDLLVQLRQPQLSKRPSEQKLSDALTEALPPLDQAVVADVAEAFRSLEEDRETLVAMTEAHGSAQAFLGHYRRYAQVAARRRAEQPRRAEQRYRTTREELAAAEEAHRQADAAATTAQERLGVLEEESDQLRARDSALRTGPEMDRARELERAAQEARLRRADADVAAGHEVRAGAELTRKQDRRDSAAGRADAAAEQLADVRQRARTEAAATRLAAEHAAEVDERLPIDGPGPEPEDADAERLRELRRSADDLVSRRERSIAHVGTLLDAEATAVAAMVEARREAERLASALAVLDGQRADAGAAAERAGTDLVAAVRAHLDSATELTVPDVAGVLAALELWSGTLDGQNPARTGIDAAGRAATEALARTGAVLDRRGTDAEARAAELAAEIARLEAGEHGTPPPPHTRDPDARTDRAGAPLWQLIDFADGIGDDDRAGLEAALEASGMLDAWLAPDGTLRDVTGDVLLVPEAGGTRPVPALTAVLRPAADPQDARAAAVPGDTVADVLAAVGLGAGNGRAEPGTWIDTDGRFRIGVLTGAWRKPAAEYIGRGARDAARRARLAVLRTDAERVAAEQAGIAAERQVLDGRRARLATEIDTLPGDTELREAHATVLALAARHAELTWDHDDAGGRLATATATAEAAARARVSGAADVGLPDDRAGLDAVRTGLTRYQVALAGLWPAASALATARRGQHEATIDLAGAETAHREAVTRASDAEREARRTEAEYTTKQETIGDTVRELHAKLDAVAAQIKANKRHRETTSAEHTRAIADRGKAEGRRDAATAALEVAAGDRAEAAESMRRFATTGLLAIALPELAVPDPDGSWAPEPTVRLARQIDQDLTTVAVDDQAWDRVQRRVNDEFKVLTDTLARQGNAASAHNPDDGFIVEVTFRGRPATVPELTEALGREVTDRQRLLDAREREILENHLINEVASTLQELIFEADRQVQRMNAELSDRPTSTGMLLRLEWQPDPNGPTGLAEARRRLLRQTADAWSPDDRAALGGFLQEQIAVERARDESGTWLEHLGKALDYRTWHRFAIRRYQNGQWRPATGPASGGERVLAASVPLFAAASSHYASAGNPHAPRLVMLDEAFAGVDDNARAKYLGLLAAFELDVVMTSEREWGCYPEVPGLAIAQLARADGVPAVLVTNWRWDGHQRTRGPRPVPVPAEPSSPEPEEVSLF